MALWHLHSCTCRTGSRTPFSATGPARDSKLFPCLVSLLFPDPEILIFFFFYTVNLSSQILLVCHLFTFSIIFSPFVMGNVCIGLREYFSAQKFRKLNLKQGSNISQARAGGGGVGGVISCIQRPGALPAPSLYFTWLQLSSAKYTCLEQSRGQLSDSWVALS